MRPDSIYAELKSRSAHFADHDQQAIVQDFGDAAAEATAIHEGGAIRDQSLASILWFRGDDRVEFVNGQCTNDVRNVTDDVSIMAAVTTPKGRVVDHVQIFAADDAIGTLGSFGRGEHLLGELAKKIVMEKCEVAIADDFTCFLACGPNAPSAIETVFKTKLDAGDNAHAAAQADFDGAKVTLLGTRAPGGSGVNIIVPVASAGACITQLVDAGLMLVGETAYEQARIEAGLPHLGREMGDHTNPLESGLIDSVSFTKGCYVGQEVIARLQNYRRVKRHLIGIRFPLGANVNPEDEVFWDLLRVGNITSACRSESLGATVALALIKADYGKPGNDLYVVHDSERTDGKAAELPFSKE